MANKFTQSVLQRLEQEQKVQNKTKPQIKTVTKTTDDIIKAPVVLTDKSSEKADATDNNRITDIPDISDYLRLEPGRIAKNKTFYLDVEVIDALCAAARRQKVTDSKLCNDILRRVLGVGAMR